MANLVIIILIYSLFINPEISSSYTIKPQTLSRIYLNLLFHNILWEGILQFSIFILFLCLLPDTLLSSSTLSILEITKQSFLISSIPLKIFCLYHITSCLIYLSATAKIWSLAYLSFIFILLPTWTSTNISLLHFLIDPVSSLDYYLCKLLCYFR